MTRSRPYAFARIAGAMWIPIWMLTAGIACAQTRSPAPAVDENSAARQVQQEATQPPNNAPVWRDVTRAAHVGSVLAARWLRSGCWVWRCSI